MMWCKLYNRWMVKWLNFRNKGKKKGRLMDTITIPITRVVQTEDEITQLAKDIEDYVKEWFRLRKKNIERLDYEK